MSNGGQSSVDVVDFSDQEAEPIVARPAYAGVVDHPVTIVEFGEEEAEPISVPVREIEFTEPEQIVARSPYAATIDYPVTAIDFGEREAEPIVARPAYAGVVDYPATIVEFGEEEAEQISVPVREIEFTEPEQIVARSPYAATIDYPVTAINFGEREAEPIVPEGPYPGVVDPPVRAGEVPRPRPEQTVGLTARHRALLARERIPADPVAEWGTTDAARAFLQRRLSRQGVSEFLAGYKDRWVHAHRGIIQAAARENDVPDWVLGGVAWTEVGGDPSWFDEGGVKLRQYFAGDPGRTSFGPVQIQLNRAAEELGYDPAAVSSIQRRVLIWTLDDPQNDIFVVASHLRRLKEIDAPGRSAAELSDNDVRLIGARYNRGAGLTIRALTTLGQRTRYGDDLLRKRERIQNLLRD